MCIYTHLFFSFCELVETFVCKMYVCMCKHIYTHPLFCELEKAFDTKLCLNSNI